MTVNGLFNCLNSSLFAKVVSTQQAKVIVRVDVIEGEYEVD